jgi:hypothetical protein
MTPLERSSQLLKITSNLIGEFSETSNSTQEKGRGTIIPDSQPVIGLNSENSSGLDNCIHRPKLLPERIFFDNVHLGRVLLVSDVDDSNMGESRNEPPPTITAKMGAVYNLYPTGEGKARQITLTTYEETPALWHPSN